MEFLIFALLAIVLLSTSAYFFHAFMEVHSGGIARTYDELERQGRK